MSSTDATEPKVDAAAAPAPAAETTSEEKKTLASSSVFSMFGGGAKKEKKEDEDRGDVSGSAKSQRDAAKATGDDDAPKKQGGDEGDGAVDIDYTIKEHDMSTKAPISQQTGEEDEEEVFALADARMLRREPKSGDWKGRGKGKVRFLRHKITGKTRLIMRREVGKVSANQYVSPHCELLPNPGFNDGWIWSTLDYSDNPEGEAMTLAIRWKEDTETAAKFKKAWDEHAAANKAIEKKEEA